MKVGTRRLFARTWALVGFPILLALFLTKPNPTDPHFLPAEVREEADLLSGTLAFTASLVSEQALESSRRLDRTDEAMILETCREIEENANALSASWDSWSREQAAAGIDELSARRHLFARMRERGRTVMLGVCVLKTGALFSPGLQGQGGAGAQDSMQGAIQNLLGVLAGLSPDSRAAEGVRRAIVALRRAIIPFDDVAPTVRFLKPEENAILNAPPEVIFEIADGGSGPDPASAKLRVVISGPQAPRTYDLSVLLSAVAVDPVAGVVRVALGGEFWDSGKDGFLTFQAEAADLAGNVAGAFRHAVLDRVAPVIEVRSPLQGESVESVDSVLVDASMVDSLSGVLVGNIRLFLNGNDVTSLVGLSPASGSAGVVEMSGILTPREGSNTLEIQGSDAAFNYTSALVTFQVTLPRPFQLALENTSGDGQVGLANHCLDELLVVRAYNVYDSQGVPGVSLSARVVDGDGQIVERALMTDQEGFWRCRLRLGALPVGNRVEVGVLADRSVAPVQLLLHAERPQFTDETERNPGNPHLQNQEFAGSALPRIFRVKAKKSDDTPLPGETVDAAVTLFNNEPPTSEVGYFMPARAVTDAEGVAEFLFVIHKGMSPGPLELSFFLTAYLEANGDPVRVRSTGRIREPVPPGRERVAEIESGQGQIAIPGVRINKPLGVRFIHNPDNSIPPETYVAFQFIEGSGRITVVDGMVQREFANDGGKTGVILIGVTGASVKVTLDPGVKLALVDVGPASDVFAIGTPEARLVLAEDPTVETSGFVAMPIETPDPASRFLLECRMPAAGIGPVKAEVESLDLCDRRLEVEGALAPSRITDLEMSLVGEDSEGRYAVYRSPSDKPFVATDTVTLPGGPTPTLPGNLTPIQAFQGGALKIGYLAGSFRATTPQAVETSIHTDDFFVTHRKPFRMTVRRGTEPMPMGRMRFDWTLQVGDADPVRISKASTLWVKLAEENPNLTAAGIVSDSPVTLFAAAGDKRGKFRAFVSPPSALLSPYRNLLIALESSRLAGERAPTAADYLPRYTAREGDFISLVGLSQAERTTLLQDVLEQLGTTAVGPFNRIVLTSVPSGGELAVTHGQIRMSGNLMTPFSMDVFTGTFGTAFRPLGLNLSLEDLGNVVSHELFHVTQFSGGRRREIIPGYTAVDILISYLNTNFYSRPEAERTRPNFNDFARAAAIALIKILEVEASADQVGVAIREGNISFFYLDLLTKALVRDYNDLIDFLRVGLMNKKRNPTAIPRIAVGSRLDSDLRRFLVMDLLQRIYREIPESLREMQGPEMDIVLTIGFDRLRKNLGERKLIFPTVPD